MYLFFLDATSPSSSVQTPLPASTQENAKSDTPITAFFLASSSGLLLKHAEINRLHKILGVRELTALSLNDATIADITSF
jgi:hypothetical protein